MFKQDKLDDDQFQVILSREDYEGLKKCRDDYNGMRQEFEQRVKSLEAEKDVMAQRVNGLFGESERLKIEKQEIQQLVARMYDSLSDHCSKMTSISDSQLPLSNQLSSVKNQISLVRNQQSKNSLNTKHNSSGPVYKLNASIEFMNDILDRLRLSLQQQRQKATNLVKEFVLLKQENFRLNVQLSQNNEKFNSLQEQGQHKEQSLQRCKIEIDRLKLSIKQVHEYHGIQSSKLKSQNHKHCQQLESLNKKLASLLNQSQFLQQQLSLSQQQNSHLHKQTKDLQDQIKEYQQHIMMLKQSIELSSRQKEHNKRAVMKSKFEKEDYIKETLVEFVREIRRNLISIGNLSQEEIRQIGTSELKTLVKFIQELQEDFQ